MARTASKSAIDQERWQVRLSPGCTVEMTVDQLDAAFDAGAVGAKTEVRAPGGLRFTTLGEAAALDDSPRESPHSVSPFAADIAPASVESLGAFDALPGAPPPARARRGRVGSVIAIVLMFLVLIAIGMGGGAYAARPAEMRAKVTALRAKITASPRAAVVASPPPPKIDPPPAPAPPPAPPAVVSAAPSQVTATVDHLPSAPNASDKGAKVKNRAPAKSKPRK